MKFVIFLNLFLYSLNSFGQSNIHELFSIVLNHCKVQAKEKKEDSPDLIVVCNKDYKLVSCKPIHLKENDFLKKDMIYAYYIKNYVDINNMDLENKISGENFTIKDGLISYSKTTLIKDLIIKKKCKGFLFDEESIKKEIQWEK